MLRWIGEQYAVSLPQLARLMGRSEHAARWLRSRWQRAGWAAGGGLVVGQPVFVWLTPAGARLCGSPLKVWEPNPGVLAHVAAVKEVRLHVATRRPEAEWISARELARNRAARSALPPDAVVVAEGRRVAVEVGLSQKSARRLEAIVLELLRDYDVVWYLAAAGPVTRALGQLVDRVGGGRLHVAPLPEASE